ncbi:FGGY family carbohydrate kinase [Thermaurantiacus sp.]
MALLLALDAGTTSTRALAIATDGRVCASAARQLTQRFPEIGWVEQDAAEIRDLTRAAAEAVVREVGAGAITAVGLTNQRETAVAWDRATGTPLAPAISWQDRRTADLCARLRQAGQEPQVQATTGLLLDPYFSATKWAWMLAQVPQVAAAAAAGRLMLGTIDSWLLFALSGGAIHATDVTNASRTLLMDLRTGAWDRDLCALLGVPESALPAIRPSVGQFGTLRLGGRDLAVTGVAGDQQAAAVGQGCLAPGETKCTYGTGIFLLAASGARVPQSHHRLLATRAATAGEPAFALEGSVFVGGDAVKWLRDRLGLIGAAAETEALAASVPDSGGVTLVPAFAGLGAPWWEPRATGMLTGLTGATSRAHIARATLEAMGNQTADLLEAFAGDDVAPSVLKVDGGMVANDWLCQDLADATGLPVVRPANIETTALGAAMLAAVGTGLVPDLATAAARMVRPDRRFEPRSSSGQREARRAGWRCAIAQVLAGVQSA